MRCRSAATRKQPRGLGLLGLLILLVLLGVVAASAVQLGSLAQRREAEDELLFIGLEFQRALASYAAATPAGMPRAPRALDDLLRDRRARELRRHLRRIYIDPVARADQWGLVRSPDGGIIGIHSLSDAAPIREHGFDPVLAHLEGRVRYHEWIFRGPP